MSINEEQDAVNLERYLLFRSELETALRGWERHTRMNFEHLVSLDARRYPSGGTCDTALAHVWFRAQTKDCYGSLQGQANANGENEFDPSFGSPQNPDGSDRILCIDWKILAAGQQQVPYFAGHESGHILGLEHEHARWDQEAALKDHCREDNYPFEPISPDRALTPADPWSVMGYGECEGSEGLRSTLRIGPDDRLGAYYTFNWSDRRVRDMAPQVGGVAQRRWAGDERSGILWYLTRPDRLLEWRFDADQPGQLNFETIERCLGDSPCVWSDDSGGHWHPIMGRFSGSAHGLDVFMYAPDERPDILLRNQSQESSDAFERVDTPAPDRAIPIVGNFVVASGRDEILWYRPGSLSDHLWSFDEAGQHFTLELDVDQSDYRIPIPGHFRSRTHATDIIWFKPSDATLDTWIFEPGAVFKGVGSAELLGVEPGVEYLPLVGNFDGDNRTDMFWYAPGLDADYLWLSDSNPAAILWDSYQFAVDGEYHPIVGDFDADGDDDILWYRPAGELAGGLSWLWRFDGAEIEPSALQIVGDYVPYAEDFDNDGCTDILWYDPVAPNNPSPLWRCNPQDLTFSCEQPIVAPKASYPVGVNGRGY